MLDVLDGEASAVPASRQRPARPPRPPLGLLVPGLATALAVLLPIGYLVVRAAGGGVAALQVLTGPRTMGVLVNSAVLAALVAGFSVALAVPLAWLTTRTDLPGRRAWALVASLPLCIPTFVGGFTFVAAFGPRGALQALLEPLGVTRLPEVYGLPGAVAALTMFSYPYVLLPVRGALLGLDPNLDDAARGLGLSARSAFFRVTLPQLRPAISAGALLVALYALSDFGAVSLLRYDSFTRAIYVQYRSAFDRTPAAVLALVLVAFTLLLLAIEARARSGRERYSVAVGGSQRPAPPVALGAWRWPAVAACVAVVTGALVVPMAVLGYWLVRGLAAGEQLRSVVEAAGNSLWAAGWAAACAAILALPVALLSARHRGALPTFIERATYAGYALPGVVVALALVFVGARIGGPLYQTLPVLVFAYVVRFLPQAVAATRTALLQVPPAIEEAARGLGRGGLAVLLRVTGPLVRPGALAGAGLVFLTAMKELPTTLLLGPTGYPTLATRVWSATSEAFFARAAAPALLLVLLSGLPVALLMQRAEVRA